MKCRMSEEQRERALCVYEDEQGECARGIRRKQYFPDCAVQGGVDMMKFTIPLNPVTKKNSQRIVKRGNRYIPLPSEAYEQYEKDCGHFIKPPKTPICEPINVKATYYMQTRRKVDLANLHNALHDILVKYRVVEDDNSRIIVSTDGSRVGYDKENPRTEIEITLVGGE